MKGLRWRWLAVPMLAGALGALGWAAFAPVQSTSREALFEIPDGTWARRMSGAPVEIPPSEIPLPLGVRDVLLLRNLDRVPQVFGPTVMMPGQSFRLPFEVASSYQFACTAHASGQMTVIVDPQPLSPWARVRWRAIQLWTAFA
jgi:hypothetical protein